MTKKMEGFNRGFGLVYISSYSYEFEVCETKHTTDYKIVTDWINKN